MTNSAVLLDGGINNDYTEWRKDNLFAGMSLDEIIDKADEYCKEFHQQKQRKTIKN